MFNAIEPARKAFEGTSPAPSEHARHHFKRWRRLCSEFLPIHKEGELWRHSRYFRRSDPTQGWKIHISATILTACDVMESVGPYLKKNEVAFKAAATLGCLERLNAGLRHGYSQIGKFITIYPSDEKMFKKLVAELAEIVPREPAPSVPFEARYHDTNIYYRYGSFVSPPGDNRSMIFRPDGDQVPDRRDIHYPEWVTDPFPRQEFATVGPSSSPLPSRYRVFASISQRGKGGVYKAIDTEAVPPRLCIVKEGRLGGETGWDGRDGRSRIENEADAIAYLRSTGVAAPLVYDSFYTDQHFYLVLEHIQGDNLQNLLSRRRRRLRISYSLNLCKRISRVLADIHAAGRVWRDCKPGNLLISANNIVRPVDFEGSCPANKPDPFTWSSPDFSAPELIRSPRLSSYVPFAEDLYSLGVTLFCLIEAKLPKAWGKCPICKDVADIGFTPADNLVQGPTPLPFNCSCRANRLERRGLPDSAKSIILKLLSQDPVRRPPSELVFKSFESM